MNHQFPILRRLNSGDFKNVDPDTLRCALTLIEDLKPFYYDRLIPENIFPSLFDTVCLDWEWPADKLLSVEIGKNSATLYFESSGKTKSFVEGISHQKVAEKMEELITEFDGVL